MLTFHPVNIDRELDRSHPLFVGNFYPLRGMWWSKRKQRQGLIISIAVAWYRITKSNPSAPGFIQLETFLTQLTSQVKDARKALERFFEVTKVGYSFGEARKNPSIVTPRKLDESVRKAIEELIYEISFAPGPAPTDKKLIASEVNIHKSDEQLIMKELKERGREDLIPPVAWILKQKSPITFYFRPSGKLKARDTSVWPVRAIETWPSWLRVALFGTAIDVESAYLQFVLEHLKKKRAASPHSLALLYPDLVAIGENKQEFREELLKWLHLTSTRENLKLVKSITMALANGSNASPALLTGSSTHCEVVRLIRTACPDLLPTQLAAIGKRLQSVVRQFRWARKELCVYLLREKPTRQNQKKIFHKYLMWEREARHAIWEAGGKKGLMLHDGIDGIDDEIVEAVQRKVLDERGLRVAPSL